MSYTCDKYCPGGNCIGCKNGELNCKDTRCFPNCSSQCPNGSNAFETNIIVFWIIVILIIILVIIILIFLIKNYNIKNESVVNKISSIE